MVDSQGGKKCIKQRKVLITITYNEMGIIIDTKAKEVAQPETQWIPVSERLPEERGFYLTTTKDKAVYCDYWNEDNFDRTEMVIAWMPLPEPYRGGEKE